ncbi:MAG: hypothetical protein RL689_121 [Planctomycetota bacterium]|jgi:signal transduction histidine kinase
MIVAHRWKLAFGAVVLVVAGVLSWVTVRTLGLERSERAAAGEARFQERLRLVLWRMDSALTPIIAREAARPYFEYRPFHPVDARRSTPPDAERAADQPAPVQTVMVPSPLLNLPEGGVLLHFEQASTGRLSSPQAPEGEDLTAAKGAFATPYGIAVAEERLRSLRQWFTPPAEEAVPPLMANVQAAAGAVPPSEAVAEYNARALAAASAQAVDRSSASSRGAERTSRVADAAPPAGSPLSEATIARVGITQGDFGVRWLDGPGGEPQLVLVREVRSGDSSWLQGVWLDWPMLRAMLLDTSRGVFPAIELRPLRGGPGGEDPGTLGRTLAAIPLEVAATPPPLPPAPAWTPVRAALALTWAVAVAAMVAAGRAIASAVELAARRGQFVSAVTHELRTPLTTFCLYSQMLDDGLVPEGEPRKAYFRTLREESTRLARIVESVLEYARLGGKGRRTVDATVPLAPFVDSIVASLAPSCERAGMSLTVERHDEPGFDLRADATLVERVLANLVENACRYAREATDRRVHLEVHAGGGQVRFVVRDHGPGVAAGERERIFRPFVRGESQGHGSVPGLGLGLAIARTLVREAGGEVSLMASAEGAAFEVRLPGRGGVTRSSEAPRPS